MESAETLTPLASTLDGVLDCDLCGRPEFEEILDGTSTELIPMFSADDGLRVCRDCVPAYREALRLAST